MVHLTTILSWLMLKESHNRKITIEHTWDKVIRRTQKPRSCPNADSSKCRGWGSHRTTPLWISTIMLSCPRSWSGAIDDFRKENTNELVRWFILGRLQLNRGNKPGNRSFREEFYQIQPLGVFTTLRKPRMGMVQLHWTWIANILVLHLPTTMVAPTTISRTPRLADACLLLGYRLTTPKGPETTSNIPTQSKSQHSLHNSPWPKAKAAQAAAEKCPVSIAHQPSKTNSHLHPTSTPATHLTEPKPWAPRIWA